jgi:hypothetical protein
MGHVAICKDHLINALALTDPFEVGLIFDRDAVGVVGPGKLHRISPPRDSRDLVGSKGHYSCKPHASKAGIEVVKIAPGCAENDYAIRGAVGHHDFSTESLAAPVIRPPSQ